MWVWIKKLKDEEFTRFEKSMGILWDESDFNAFSPGPESMNKPESSSIRIPVTFACDPTLYKFLKEKAAATAAKRMNMGLEEGAPIVELGELPRHMFVKAMRMLEGGVDPLSYIKKFKEERTQNIKNEKMGEIDNEVEENEPEIDEISDT